jgi:putative membrane protein
MSKKKSNYKELFLILILIIFHLVGIIGINLEAYREDILKLSSMNLFISVGIIILARKSNRSLFLFFVLLSFILGMTYEIIGVYTSFLFGTYYYGENLGLKLFGVPLVIGLNWAILAVCSGNLIHKIKLNIYIKSLFASALMVILDFLIEPVASKLDYWHWENEQIPIFNYMCWFILSLPLTFLYFKIKISEQNKISNVLYLILVLFFGILLFL